MNDSVESHKALIRGATLAFHNDTVDDFNNLLVERMPGVEHRFEAANHVDIGEDAAVANPIALVYLQSISLVSLLPSYLRLKIGTPIIFLCTLSPREGLCNGTRMRVM